jgi:hypothetical protein
MLTPVIILNSSLHIQTLLPKTLRQRLTDQAREDVGRATGRKANHNAYRPRGIGLRPSDSRDGRQRGSACCEIQERAAGKFHSVASLIFAMSRAEARRRRGRSRAQQPMIGLLSGSSPGAIPHHLAAFDRGLADNGFITAGTWRSTTTGPMAGSIACRQWPPNSFAVRWR